MNTSLQSFSFPIGIARLLKGIATFLFVACATTTEASVIYRNNFGNSTSSYISYSTVGFSSYLANDMASNVVNFSTSAFSFWGISTEAGSPTNLSNINSGVSQSDSDGFGIIGNGVVGLFFTASPIDRTLYDAEEISFNWNAALYKANPAGASSFLRAAVRIDTTWYVSSTIFGFDGSNTIPVIADSTSAQQEAQFSNYASPFELNLAQSNWVSLTATIGSPFQIGSSPSALPAGDINAFGLFIQTGSGRAYFDTLEVEVIPEPSAILLLLMAAAPLGYYCLKRRSNLSSVAKLLRTKPRSSNR